MVLMLSLEKKKRMMLNWLKMFKLQLQSSATISQMSNFLKVLNKPLFAKFKC